MPQLVPEDWAPQIIWLLISFGLLYLLMVYVALPRIGKVIEVELGAADPEAARAEVEAMCRKLLANTVIENYRVEVIG